ncbi:NUDIX [Rachiplusia nu nucleopolyhedrovirus]|uniref:NUDIX n=1 Tax=Rachiplusia nu nucleopolyhedrovirus TaxID=2605775 RepID=A0AAE6M6I9_9ABAC|nr:NUDIX [Rachiplusia nu nucleopolyhedrovirus]QEI03652.1 NUDIX [Rachiplusia nu nucleopolyhedrovirus]
MRSAGLFIIMEPDKAVLLCARQSYDGTVYYKDNAILQQANFLEKISIPRGKRDHHDIFEYETAIREFIEETGSFFQSAYVYQKPFVLQWMDCGVTYKYSIYVGIVRGGLITVSRKPNTFCVKLASNYRPNDYRIVIESRKYNNELPRYVYIVPLQDYFQYMNDKQLTTYDSSNYLEFFEFVKNVKYKYEVKKDCSRFFLLSLKLREDYQSTTTQQQWNERANGEVSEDNKSNRLNYNSRRSTFRDNPYFLTAQELKNIVNVV